ncbi:MAG: hypothetical protein J6A52_00525 [Bacilli bacterium]|nr:hypothetical protein [Bacilli bacterium]
MTLTDFLGNMGLMFDFLFEQLGAFVSEFLLGTILGQIILLGLFLAFLVFLVGSIFSWATHKK